MSFARRATPVLVLACAALSLLPDGAEAQRRRGVFIRAAEVPTRTLSLQVGGFTYDREDDDTFPMAALRVDWRLSRHIRAEVGAAYALGETEVAQGDAVAEEENTSLVSVAAGVQAEARLGPVRPYLGVAAGLFGRFDPEGGERFVRPTHEFPVGLRIALTRDLGLRAELRPRFDEHEDGRSSPDFEQTLGVTFRF